MVNWTVSPCVVYDAAGPASEGVGRVGAGGGENDASRRVFFSATMLPVFFSRALYTFP